MKMKTIFQLITLSIIYDASYGRERQLRRNLNAEGNRVSTTRNTTCIAILKNNAKTKQPT